MQKTVHRSTTRGHADHGWLDTWHTFSFADYYNPRRMHFGALRVLNDDRVAGGRGFGRHPHDNMEIVSIPLEGALRHGDSMGHTSVLHPGQIQVMSAGTGIVHSEMNDSHDRPVKFLQIWVLPNRMSLPPRYEQITLAPVEKDIPRLIVAPEGMGSESVGWIHQRAWFHTLEMTADARTEYTLQDPADGLYLFVLSGRAVVGEETLAARDGMGVWDTESILISAAEPADLLLIEVPMAIR